MDALPDSVPSGKDSLLAASQKPEKRALVVDDHNLIADTLTMVLSAQGFHALAAYDAQHALSLLEAEPFDLLLTDVMMPGMTGIDLAIDVTRRHLVHKVLLMSGVSATADLLANARKLGYEFQILAKPTYPTEVIEKLHSLLATDGAAEEIALGPFS